MAALIGELPDKENVQGESIKEVHNLAAVVNKIWLWADVATGYPVREFQAEVMEFFFDALVQRDPVVVSNIVLKAEKAKAEAAVQKAKGITLIYRGQKNPDDEVLEQAMVVAEVRAENKKRRGDYLDFVGARSEVLMDKMTNIMKVARIELGIEGDTTILASKQRT